MYCGQCGTQNNEEAGSCENCGAPLLITAGARTCGSCGASLGDGDQYCPTCGAPANSGSPGTTYEADDSFGDIDADDIDVEGLPDWLRDMAPEDAQESAPSGVGSQPSPEDLPDWLRDSGSGVSADTPPPTPTPAQSAGGSQMPHQPAEQFSLVSDEDLPDWLKALGDDTPTTSDEAQAIQPVEQQQTALATVLDVPPVSRAWLIQGRQSDPSQMTAAQQEFAPLEATGPAVPQEAVEATITSSSEAEPKDEVIDAEERTPDSSRRRVRILALVLLIVVLLLVAYVFLQGI